MNSGAKAGAGAVAAAGGAAAVAGYTLEEVAKHNSKQSCWVVLDGKVLDVTSFLSEHPGGELAILTFAGKDATEEFNMIHPPDVVGKYAPDAIIGEIGVPGAAAAPAAAAASKSSGSKTRDYTRQTNNNKNRMNGTGKVGGCFGALAYMVLGFMKEILFTIFGQ